jgi:predicted HicB family RNase H-like nuclease
MEDSSQTTGNDNEGFIGFRCDPSAKAEARAEAEKKGISLSEWMRRRLREAGTNRRDMAAA